MQKKTLFTLGFLAVAALVSAQRNQVGSHTPVSELAPSGFYKPGTGTDRWQRRMDLVATFHGSSDSISVLKAEKLLLKRVSEKGIGNDGASRSVTPEVSDVVSANTMIYGTPPDNAMAVSNAGRMVAADNDVVEFFNAAGNLVSDDFHDDFFASVGPYASIFDPRVLYDPEADRFIVVALHGSSSSSSYLLVAFSKTNNPGDGFWIYAFSGNPLNNGTWLDFPQIGISEGELFVSGNLFTNAGQYDESVIYQIDKEEGYDGANISYEVWDNIVDGASQLAFTITPAGYGQENSYGSTMYFVSSRSGGMSQGQGPRIFLYTITGAIDENPSLFVESVDVNPYSPAADAFQLNNGSLLDNGDCRMHDAFYLNGIVHCVHHAEFGNSGFNGISYYRIPVDNTNGVEQTSLGLSDFDYSYPSLASFGLNECDRSVMVAFLRSGETIYPEVRVANCDNNMNWSGSVPVSSGASYVDILTGTERWGDYSDCSRKHNATEPTVWVVGCVGTSNHSWQAKLGEITGDYEQNLGPSANFSVSANPAETTIPVQYTDLSLNNPYDWEWYFEGGTPAVSTAQNPTVVYSSPGVYDVSLRVENEYCVDSISTVGFITVNELFRDTVNVDGLTIYIVGSDSFELVGGELVPLSVAEVVDEQPLEVFPNPSYATEIVQVVFSLDQRSVVDARIYDAKGAEVKVLYADYLKAGSHKLSFNKLALPAGTYHLRILTDGKATHHEKLVILP